MDLAMSVGASGHIKVKSTQLATVFGLALVRHQNVFRMVILQVEAGCTMYVVITTACRVNMAVPQAALRIIKC